MLGVVRYSLRRLVSRGVQSHNPLFVNVQKRVIPNKFYSTQAPIKWSLDDNNLEERDEKNNTYLHYAAAEGKIENIKYLISKGLSTNSVNIHGRTPLHIAVASQKLDVCVALLESGASINAKDSFGMTPLHLGLTIVPIPEDFILYILKKGADINSRANNQGTPLAFACQYNQPPGIIKILIDNGADINAKTIDESVLATAVLKSKIEVVEILLKKGADMETKSNDGITPLRYACFYGQLEKISLLAKYGANINTVDKDGDTPLMAAAAKGDLLTLNLLIELGADLDKTNKRGSAVFYAIHNSHENCVRALVEAGANLEIKLESCSPLVVAIINGRNEIGQYLYNKKFGRTEGEKVNLMQYLVDANAELKLPLFYSASICSNVELMRYLQSKLNVDVNKQDADGKTPLMYAVVNNATKAIEELARMGADLNMKDNANISALNFAALYGHAKAIETLARLGADVNTIDSDGRNLLHYACIQSKLGIPLLIKLGVDVNMQSNFGQTPIFFASDLETFNMLINAGANISICDERGATVLHTYCQIELLPLVKRLIELGADLNAQDNNGLSPLFRTKNLAIFKLLLNSGASTEIVDAKGDTLFHFLASQGRAEMLQELIEHEKRNGKQIDTEIRGNGGMTPLLSASLSGSVETLNVLIAEGADLQAKSEDGVYAIHIAALHGTVVYYEDTHDHDCSAHEHEDHTHGHDCATHSHEHSHDCASHGHDCASHSHAHDHSHAHTHSHACASHGHDHSHTHDCASHGHAHSLERVARHIYDTEIKEQGAKDVIRELVRRGLDVNLIADIEGEQVTPAFYSNVITFPVLVELGADPNLGESEEGDKLLHMAVKDDNEELLKMMLKAGARKTEKDKEGRTPYELAVQLGHNKCSEILKGR